MKIVGETLSVMDSAHDLWGMQDKVEDGMTVVYVQLPNLCIELVHPLGEKSPVATFLLKNPKGGIHHVCLAVSSNFPSP